MQISQKRCTPPWRAVLGRLGFERCRLSHGRNGSEVRFRCQLSSKPASQQASYPVHHPFSWDFPWFSIINPASILQGLLKAAVLCLEGSWRIACRAASTSRSGVYWGPLHCPSVVLGTVTRQLLSFVWDAGLNKSLCLNHSTAQGFPKYEQRRVGVKQSLKSW